MSKNDGGPAFPHQVSLQSGMSLRDYFAAKAMKGMIAAGCTVDIDGEYPFQKRAKTAYLIADAMLAERERNQ